MRIIRSEVGGEGEYTVLERPINGHDWEFTRRPGRLYIFKPLPSGTTVEVPWEPSSPDEQARIDSLDLFTVAAWAYRIAVDSDRGAAASAICDREGV